MMGTSPDGFLELWVSGRNYRLMSIELHPEQRVLEWRKLVSQGAHQLGPVSTGIGLIGAAGWVIAGALTLGAIESALTSASQKEGLRLLNQASVLYEQFRKTGRLIPIGLISGLEQPTPGSWRGMVEDIELTDLRTLTSAQLAAIHAKRPFSFENNVEDQLKTRVAKNYLSVSEEFVTGIDQEHGNVTVRWSSVDVFKIVTP
jgi:hypothetical protein